MRTARRLAILGVILGLTACGWFKEKPQLTGWPLIFNQPDTLSLVRYENRGLDRGEPRVLRFYADSTYEVTVPADGTVVHAGLWKPSVEDERLCMSPDSVDGFDCSIRVLRHWLHDRSEQTGNRLWNESPLNESWPGRE